MPRQTISLTDPNHAWLQARVDSGEFKTHTEAVNDALRRAREMEAEFLHDRLLRARESGFTDMTREEILAESKDEMRRNGEL
jgi:antitoxin ParD1/3/4